jgi:hypothetical protein
MGSTGYSVPEPDPEPTTDRLPLPVPEFNWRDAAFRVLAAVLFILLMRWVATR